MEALGPLGAIAAIAAVCAAAMFLRAGWATFRAGTAAWLATQPIQEPASGWPRLALIFAARNEVQVVEPAVRSMLAQDYPALEIIAVDDRSSDGTGPLLDAIAAANARLRVVHVAELPPAWLGKNHALQAGAEATGAEWLLFTDADVLFEPQALRRAVAYAIARHVDHLVVAPQTVTEHEGERVFLAMVCILFALRTPPWRVADPQSKVALGVGAFNLVRAEAFRAIGGLRRLALSVDDDLQLGTALKFAGYRPALALGRGVASVRWEVGLGGLIRGMEKNFFALCGFRLSQAAAIALLLVATGILPYVAVAVGPWWARGVGLFAILVLTLSLAALKGQNGIAWYHALFLPLGAVACLVALGRSVWCTLRHGGVRWREHFYPLAALREHVRLRNAWLREVWLSTR